MYTPTYIRKFIFSLPLNRIFTTREVLICGTRNAVDQALWRLVKAGIIVRLARGVFIREGSKHPTAFEVAQAKCRAFCKQIAEHGSTLAVQLELIDKKDDQAIFVTTGRSSKFWFGQTLVRIKSISARKMQLTKSVVGKSIASLWYLGRQGCHPAHIEKIILSLFRRNERRQLKLSRPLMPEWLGRHFISHTYIPLSEQTLFASSSLI